MSKEENPQAEMDPEATEEIDQEATEEIDQEATEEIDQEATEEMGQEATEEMDAIHRERDCLMFALQGMETKLLTSQNVLRNTFLEITQWKKQAQEKSKTQPQSRTARASVSALKRCEAESANKTENMLCNLALAVGDLYNRQDVIKAQGDILVDPVYNTVDNSNLSIVLTDWDTLMAHKEGMFNTILKAYKFCKDWLVRNMEYLQKFQLTDIEERVKKQMQQELEEMECQLNKIETVYQAFLTLQKIHLDSFQRPFGEPSDPNAQMILLHQKFINDLDKITRDFQLMADLVVSKREVSIDQKLNKGPGATAESRAHQITKTQPETAPSDPTSAKRKAEISSFEAKTLRTARIMQQTVSNLVELEESEQNLTRIRKNLEDCRLEVAKRIVDLKEKLNPRHSTEKH